MLQLLLSERISIRDLPTIIEGIAEVSSGMRNPREIAEHVRARLARQICAQFSNMQGVPVSYTHLCV